MLRTFLLCAVCSVALSVVIATLFTAVAYRRRDRFLRFEWGVAIAVFFLPSCTFGLATAVAFAFWVDTTSPVLPMEAESACALEHGRLICIVTNTTQIQVYNS